MVFIKVLRGTKKLSKNSFESEIFLKTRPHITNLKRIGIPPLYFVGLILKGNAVPTD